MRNHLTPWLYVFLAFFLLSETIFAQPHPVHEYVAINAAGYTKHDGPHGSIADLTSGVSSENLFQRLLEKADHNSDSSLTPVKNPHVIIHSDGPGNILPPSDVMHTAVSGTDVASVYGPASLALLGISLLSLAGISRRKFVRKITSR